MLDVERLKRVTLSLPDVGLRVAWLRDALSGLDEWDAACLLNGLCEESERCEPEARAALLPLVLYFVSVGECELVERLRELAERRALLSLLRLLGSASSVASTATANTRPVPDYGTGRELTVGERRTLARRPSRKLFDKLLADPHPLVIRQVLENPYLTEDDVVRLAARRPARLDALNALAETQYWLRRPRVRLAIVLNPGSPLTISRPLLTLCTRSELVEVLRGVDAPIALLGTARELLERRPPLREVDARDVTWQ